MVSIMNLHDLRKSPLFEGLSDEELQKLMDMAEPVSLRAGDVLIKQGEVGDDASDFMLGEGVTSAEVNAALAAFVAAALEGEGGKA